LCFKIEKEKIRDELPLNAGQRMYYALRQHHLQQEVKAMLWFLIIQQQSKELMLEHAN
jgi:hypothetical protein